MEYMAGGELYDRLFQHRVYKEELIEIARFNTLRLKTALQIIDSASR